MQFRAAPVFLLGDWHEHLHGDRQTARRKRLLWAKLVQAEEFSAEEPKIPLPAHPFVKPLVGRSPHRMSTIMSSAPALKAIAATGGQTQISAHQ